MTYLTKEQERILNGDYGEAAAVAMKVLVKIGEVLGAERLVRVNHVHVSGISYFNIGDYGLKLMEELLSKGGKFRVFTTVNPYAAVDIDFNGNRLESSIIAKQQRIIHALRRLGGIGFTCAPYFIRRPRQGEHLAWAESNAVLMATSVFGAKTNREGGPASLMAGIVGYTYYYGMHKDEVDLKIFVKVPKPKNLLEASAIGYLVGQLDPHAIPHVSGLQDSNREFIRALLAAFGASSSAPLAFIEGITPKTWKCKTANTGVRTYTLTQEDIHRLLRNHRVEEIPENTLFLIGCPHVKLEDFNGFIEELTKVNPRKYKSELWIITHQDPQIPENVMNTLRARGVKITSKICPVVTKLKLLGISSVVTNSFKAIHYIPKISGIPAYATSIHEMLKILR